MNEPIGSGELCGPCGNKCRECDQYETCETRQRLESAWNFSRADYSVEQLARAVPAAIAAWARKKAGGGPPSKADLKLPYRNEDHSVNCTGVESALKMAGHVKGLPADVMRRAVAELESHRCKRSKASVATALDAFIDALERRTR
jgi:hypothetical protein